MTLDYKQLKRDFLSKQQRLDKMKAQQRIKQAQQINKRKAQTK